MKPSIEHAICGFTELGDWELSGIHGGSFFACDPSNCIVAFASSVFIGLIRDNIEHPIGAAAGYPPK